MAPPPSSEALLIVICSTGSLCASRGSDHMAAGAASAGPKPLLKRRAHHVTEEVAADRFILCAADIDFMPCDKPSGAASLEVLVRQPWTVLKCCIVDGAALAKHCMLHALQWELVFLSCCHQIKKELVVVVWRVALAKGRSGYHHCIVSLYEARKVLCLMSERISIVDVHLFEFALLLPRIGHSFHHPLGIAGHASIDDKHARSAHRGLGRARVC
eukprot:CAMPEP_0115855722 /NCGR_PEP_ID=MMETSP0287-20121206/14688_1 /TAXON_ID=412157 /ORGANISM="Chrysochromulina rotalis, Strain UIO044" /LENGTH=214 /DNA_ID=CAMNT_0003309883 /DNA_START=394 /DNA_END=1037 /DNA_ORIENTATION=+